VVVVELILLINMKKYFIFLLLLLSNLVYSTTYYVKTGGNDSAAGTSDGTAWAHHPWMSTWTGSTTLVAGDIVYLKCGDTFYGAWTVGQSGTSGSVITVGQYGTGANPIVTGFTSITSGWTSDGSNLYHKAINGQSSAKLITVDGVNTAMGQYPDVGNYNTFESSSGTSSITDNQLTGSPSWTGAEVVLRTYDWVIHTGTITNHSTTTITYTNTDSQYPPTESGYFIRNSLSTLTTNNEWYHNNTNLYIYSTVDPSNKVIKVPTIDNLLTISGRNYITFTGISFQGANVNIFNITNSTHITITNDDLEYAGDNGINLVESGASTYLDVNTSNFNNLNSLAIIIRGSSHSYADISYNTFDKIGHILGAGGNYDTDYCCISTNSPYGMYEYNVFTNVGFNVIEYWEYASYTTIQYNFIDTYGYNKEDGGAIYTWKSVGGNNQVGCQVLNNIIFNGMGATTFNSNSPHTYGIYMDGRSANNTITGNTVINSASAGLYNNASHDHTWTNNTVLGSDIASSVMAIESYPSGEGRSYNLVSTGNILIGVRDADSSPDYPAVFTIYSSEGLDTWFTTCNNNRYVVPNHPTTDTYMYYYTGTHNHVTLSAWKTALSIDAASTGSPLSTPLAGYDDNYIHVLYNTTLNNKDFTLSTTMKDAAGTNYSGTVTIEPFESLILLGYGTTAEIVDGIYYLSPTGSDSNTGSITSPWFTLNKAWTVLEAGDIVYMRGGTYTYTSQQYLSGVNGTSVDTIKIYNYPEELPIITRGGTWTKGGSGDPSIARAGIYFSGNYVHWKEIEITGFTQDDAYVWSPFRAQDFNNCLFEKIDFNTNGGPVYLTGTSTGNLFLNCDAYEQYDPLTSYGNADGFNLESTPLGSTNTFRGCRAWNNSDDGFDYYSAEGMIITEDCWAWGNGFRENRSTVGGDGCGIKLGGASGTSLIRKVTNCLSFKNAAWGFTENEALCNMEIYNNTSYDNNKSSVWGGGFHFNVGTVPYYIKNNISYSDDTADDLGTLTNVSHNSWNLAVTITDADFISVSTTGVDGVRQSDGSLPDLDFLKLVSTSDLIDVGTPVDLNYDGYAPDLGANEYIEIDIPVTKTIIKHNGKIVVQNGKIIIL